MSGCEPIEWFLVFNLIGLCRHMKDVSEIVTFKVGMGTTSGPRRKSVNLDSCYRYPAICEEITDYG